MGASLAWVLTWVIGDSEKGISSFVSDSLLPSSVFCCCFTEANVSSSVDILKPFNNYFYLLNNKKNENAYFLFFKKTNKYVLKHSKFNSLRMTLKKFNEWINEENQSQSRYYILIINSPSSFPFIHSFLFHSTFIFEDTFSYYPCISFNIYYFI